MPRTDARSASRKNDTRSVKSTKFLKKTFTPAGAFNQVVEMSKSQVRKIRGQKKGGEKFLLPNLTIIESPEVVPTNVRPGKIYGSNIQIRD